MAEPEHILFLAGLQASVAPSGAVHGVSRLDSADDTTSIAAATTFCPFTYRFLGLRLRLAFTKRRFDRLQASYREHISASAARRRLSVPPPANAAEGRGSGGGLSRNINNNNQHIERQEELQRLEVVAGDELEVALDSSISRLRLEIERIEDGEEKMRRRALPKVRELLSLHESFRWFLLGFMEKNGARDEMCKEADSGTSSSPSFCDDSEESRSCMLPMLNQGAESTVALKRLIAEFAGVPTGRLVQDLKNLECLLKLEDGRKTVATFLYRQRRPITASTVEGTSPIQHIEE